MKIESKYNIGDKIYFLEEQEGKCKGKINLRFGKIYRISTFSYDDGDKHDIKYEIQNHSKRPKDNIFVYEEYVNTDIYELIKNLTLKFGINIRKKLNG